MPTGLIQVPNSAKTVPNSAKYRPTRATADQPLQKNTELHQKDLRINLVLVYILGMVLEGVPKGGHYSGLKSNRPVFGVPRVELAPTCRYFSQTAVSKSH